MIYGIYGSPKSTFLNVEPLEGYLFLREQFMHIYVVMCSCVHSYVITQSLTPLSSCLDPFRLITNNKYALNVHLCFAHQNHIANSKDLGMYLCKQGLKPSQATLPPQGPRADGRPWDHSMKF